MNKDNLFDVIDSKMFSVFARDDRRSNYYLLSTIYDIFTKKEHKQAILKDDLVDNLTAFINGRSFDSLSDENGENINLKSSKEKALAKIRQFKKCHWLDEDTTDGFEIVVSLNENSISLIETFQSMISNKNSPIEYTGYFYTIYSLLVEFEYKNSKALIEQILKNTRELFNSLQGLNSSIREFIEELITNPDLKPQDVLDILLNKYQDQIMLTVFNNLKGKDNPSKYTTIIMNKLYEIRYDRIDEAVKGYLQTTNDKATEEKYQEVKNKIECDLDECIDRFSEVDSFVSAIDRKNSKFFSSAQATLNFLLNNKKDIEGEVSKSLRLLKNVEDNESCDDVINVYSSGNIDENSLYSRAFNKLKETYVISEKPKLDNEEIEKAFEKFLQDDKFSKDKVNAYTNSLIANKDTIELENIEVNTIEDVIMMIMLQIFSAYEEMNYQIVFLPGKVNRCGYELENFKIVKKEKVSE